MNEGNWEIDLAKVCRCYVEDFYPSFVGREEFKDEKENWHFKLNPAAEAEADAWAQFVQRSTGRDIETESNEFGLFRALVKVSTGARFWLIRRFFTPPANLVAVWNWMPEIGGTDPLLDWPIDLINEFFMAARRKLRQSSVFLPEGAPAEAETAAPKS